MAKKNTAKAPRLNPDVRTALERYRAGMLKACKTYWPNEFGAYIADVQKAAKAKQEKSIKLPDSDDLEIATRNLMITLATEPALTRAVKFGDIYPHQDHPGWPGRYHSSYRWRAASPFYGSRYAYGKTLFVNRGTYPRRDWFEFRMPAIQTITLKHQEIRATKNIDLDVVEQSLRRAAQRWRLLQESIYRYSALGGHIWWDIEPKNSNRSHPTLFIHLHATIEPYIPTGIKGVSGADALRNEIAPAWEATAHKSEIRTISFNNINMSKTEFLRTQGNRKRSSIGIGDHQRMLMYGSGFASFSCKNHARFYPKFMHGFAPHTIQRTAQFGKIADAPDIHQLRLIHAAYLVKKVFNTRWFGLWNFCRPILRNPLSEEARGLTNNRRAKTYLKVK